jgi:tetratricopeptide (TPR) repeat protein
MPNAAGIVVFFLSFLVYLSTVCPTIYLGDSGELTAAAFSLGIPHNSGYPLYAITGKLFCLVPVGSIGFRVNLMSSLFAALTVWLVYSLILKITSSKLSAFAGALFLAFVPVLWSQTLLAEVYTLHAFFVALLIRLLWAWDENRQFSWLALFVFMTGLSFGNHMQTVMLAPAVLFIIISADHKVLFRPGNLFLLSAVFLMALSLYVYLPIRTEAGAAIHWGDPNTLDRFIAHVGASAHRESYVFTKGPLEYALRLKETLVFVCSQFGVLILLAIWGCLKMPRTRWKIFFFAIILFDIVYTVFLNIIAFEITPFTLPTCIVLAMLLGIGAAHILDQTNAFFRSKITYAGLRTAFSVMPLIPLFFNFGLCDQSRNYAAYEHVLNIFRTVENQGTLLLDGDNNIFPVTFGRTVERMRSDVVLYDRLNLFFKMPGARISTPEGRGQGEPYDRQAEERIVENAKRGVYYAVFNPYALSTPPEFVVHPCGVIFRAVRDRDMPSACEGQRVWAYYVTESVYDGFHKDFMNRHLSAHFHLALGKYLFMAGQPQLGLKETKWASQIAHDDTMIHSDIAVFLIDQGLLDEARPELERAIIYNEDLSGVYTNWGYYYYKLRDYDNAVASFRKALQLNPEKFDYYNNLGQALYQAGRNDEAAHAFQQSLAIRRHQPVVVRFLQESGLNQSFGQ